MSPACPSCVRSNLKRYLHYLTRFEANLQACKLEEKLRKVCQTMVWQSLWQLSSAVQQLLASRRSSRARHGGRVVAVVRQLADCRPASKQACLGDARPSRQTSLCFDTHGCQGTVVTKT